VKGLWPIYILAFTAYAYWLAALAREALAQPALLALVVGIVAVVAVAAGVRRRVAFRLSHGVTFVTEDIDQMFAGFGLSESIAADSQPTMFPRVRSDTSSLPHGPRR
jgi:hypothetical protein